MTHDQVEAMTLGTRIVVMNQGMIQQVAPPAELYRNPVNKFVAGFIGSPTMNFLDVDVLEEDGTVWLLGQGWRLPLEGYQARKLKRKRVCGKTGNPGDPAGRPSSGRMQPEKRFRWFERK